MNDAAQFQETTHEALLPLVMAQEALAAVQQPQEATEQPLLIGIGGKYGAGKDALADYLVSHYGFAKLNMSDPLATALYTLNPWIPTHTPENDEEGIITRYRDLADDIGYTEAKKNLEVRRLLQVLGTEVGRDQLDPEVWTKVAARSIAELRDSGIPAVITGIRYPNELGMVRSAGGALVWVERPELNLLTIGDPQQLAGQDIEAIPDALSTGLTQFHSSEITLSATDFDITVMNESTLEDLRWRAGALIETLKDLTAGTTPDLDMPYFS